MLLSNIHTHGLQVSPSGNADNPFLIFKPGESFDYEIKLPANQPAGLHWYHPHRHGSSAKQGWAGLGGAIVVEGAIDKVPEVAAAPERLMLLQEIWVDNDGHVPMGMPIPVAGEVPFSTIPAVPTQVYYSINGVHQPVIRTRPAVERWRLNNEPASSRVLAPATRSAGSGRTDRVREADAGKKSSSRRESCRGARQGRRAAHVSAARARADQGHPEGRCRRNCSRRSSGKPGGRQAPATLVRVRAIANEPIVARRKVVFSGNTSMAPVQFFLDGKPFDASRDDAVVKGGTVEEWTLVNEDVFQHPFHIHVNPFQVVEINGKPVTDGIWWDTFPLPARGTVKVRMKFRPDIAGRTVYHCHILPHEDNGMMSPSRSPPQEAK
jgi:FtsP/CotA-like multicopper oxidase with cupredoxin domain